MASDWGLSVMQGIYNIANFIVDLTPIGTVKSAYNCYQAIKRGDTKEAIREGFSVAIDVVLFFTGGKIIKKAEKVLAKGVKALKNIVKARKAASRTAKVVKESTKLAEAANKFRKLAGKAGEKIAGAGKFVSSKLHRSKTVSRSEQPRNSGSLGAELLERYTYDGRKITDITDLPGSQGMEVGRRLSPDELRYLTDEYEVEFALVYKYGKGKNGRGGSYHLYSGIENRVSVPVQKDTMLIYHTHPEGYLSSPSKEDYKLMKYLKAQGSPQNISTIVPVKHNYLVKFNTSTWYKDYSR